MDNKTGNLGERMQAQQKVLKISEPNKIRRAIGWLPELSRYSCVVYICIAIILCTTTICFYTHGLVREFEKFNWLFCLIALIVCIAIVALMVWKARRSTAQGTTNTAQSNHFTRNIWICAIVLFVLQIVLFFGMFFITGWDVSKIMFKFGDEQYYFNMYPNNVFMHGIALKLAAVIRALGLDNLFTSIFSHIYPSIITKINEYGATHPDYLSYAIGYAIIAFVGVVGTNLSCVMLGFIVRKKSSDKFALFAFVIAGIFIGLCPWILVPYSDIFALIFVTIILWAYVCIANSSAKCATISIATVIGFNVKPTVCFCVLAILFVEFCKFVRDKWNLNNIRQLLHPIITIALCGGLCLALVTVVKQLDFEPDKNMQMTSTHFLMMGLNPQTDGFFSEADVQISQAYDNTDEREAANIAEIQNRLQQMGPVGLLKLFTNKTMINYGDSTFQWEMDGGQEFYLMRVGNIALVKWVVDSSQPLRSIIWFALLLGVILCAAIKHDKTINVMTTSILILSLFLVVFESGSRYLILYTPYFTILGLLGWRNIYKIAVLKYCKTKH